MTPAIDKHGYKAVVLRAEAGGRQQRRTVHRLVALAFLPNPDALTDVAHNDGNPSNNNVDNLRWASHRENQLDMRVHGTMQDGEKCCTAKLTIDQVAEIRHLAQKRGMGIKLAKQYGMSKAQISRIKNGRRWQAFL